MEYKLVLDTELLVLEHSFRVASDAMAINYAKEALLVIYQHMGHVFGANLFDVERDRHLGYLRCKTRREIEFDPQSE